MPGSIPISPNVTVGRTAMACSPYRVMAVAREGIVYLFPVMAVGRAVNKSRQIPWLVLTTILVLLFSVALYRILLFYYLVPTILKDAWSEGPFWNLKRILAHLVDIGFVAACAVAMKFLRMSWLSRIREKKLLQEKLEAELKFLRTQTNPHFLFNTLNNIYALARKKSDPYS